MWWLTIRHKPLFEDVRQFDDRSKVNTTPTDDNEDIGASIEEDDTDALPSSTQSNNAASSVTKDTDKQAFLKRVQEFYLPVNVDEGVCI